MTDLKQALKQLRSARDSLMGEIKELDAQIAARTNQRSQLTSGAVSKADFLEFVRRDMTRRSAFFEQGLMRAVEAAPADYGTLNRLDSMKAKLNISYLTGSPVPMEITEGAVYFYFGDALVDRLATALEGLEWPESIATVAERVPLIATLDAEIEALNKQRAGLAAALVDAGLAG